MYTSSQRQLTHQPIRGEKDLYHLYSTLQFKLLSHPLSLFILTRTCEIIQTSIILPSLDRREYPVLVKMMGPSGESGKAIDLRLEASSIHSNSSILVTPF